MREQSRLDVLEGRVDELTRQWDRLFGEIGRLDQKIDRRFEAVDRKMGDLGAELSKQFRWTFRTMLALLGIMLTVGAGVATALLRN